MEPRACVVLDSSGPHDGWLLAWQRAGESWRGLCRYVAPVDGHPLLFERWLPASALSPREPSESLSAE